MRGWFRPTERRLFRIGSPRFKFLRGVQRGIIILRHTGTRIRPSRSQSSSDEELQLSPYEQGKLREHFGIECDRQGYPHIPPVDEPIWKSVFEALGPDRGPAKCRAEAESWAREWIIDAIAAFVRRAAEHIRQQSRQPRPLAGKKKLGEDIDRLKTIKNSLGDFYDDLVWDLDGTNDELEAVLRARPITSRLLDENIAKKETEWAAMPMDRGGRVKGYPHSPKYRLVSSCISIAHFWNADIIKISAGRSGMPSLWNFVTATYGIIRRDKVVDLESDIRKCVKTYKRLIDETAGNQFTFLFPVPLELWLSQLELGTTTSELMQTVTELSRIHS